MRKILFVNCAGNPLYDAKGHILPFLQDPYEIINAEFEPLPNSIDNYSHIILSGSVAPSYESKWQFGLYKFVNKILEENIPILGICYGHQIIIRELFGYDRLAKKTQEDVGWEKVTVCENDTLLGEKGALWVPFTYHGYEISSVPNEQVRIIASSANCKVAAYKITNKPVWGFQPHFEISGEQATILMDNFNTKPSANLLGLDGSKLTFSKHNEIFNRFFLI